MDTLIGITTSRARRRATCDETNDRLFAWELRKKRDFSDAGNSREYYNRKNWIH